MLRFRAGAETDVNYDGLPGGHRVPNSPSRSKRDLDPPLSTKRRSRNGIVRWRITILICSVVLYIYYMTQSTAPLEDASIAESNSTSPLTLQDRWRIQRDKWLAQKDTFRRIYTSSPPQQYKSKNRSRKGIRVENAYEPDYAATLMELYRRFPNINGSELSFAQMAYQTNLYAQILRDESLDEDTLRLYESNLWSFFVPGINDLREACIPFLSRVSPSRSSFLSLSASKSKSKRDEPLRRGIVMSTNEGRVKFACHFLAVLREVYQSDLPVEIYHYGEKEMPAKVREHLESNYGVTVIDLQKIKVYDEVFVKLQNSGWATKAFALMATQFQEVIMADDDTVFLLDPEKFFVQKAYKETGTLFYRDRYLPTWKSERGIEFIKQQLGFREPTEMLTESKFWKESLWHQQESGVVVVNKSRPEVFAALLFIAWENSFPIRNAITYDYFYGDKESFWLAFELAGFAYHMASHDAGMIGDEHAEFADGLFCTDKPLHFLEVDDEANERVDTIDPVPDPTHPNKTLGLPAWFNGSLKAFKHRNSDKDIMMEVSKSTWAIDGEWKWNDNGKCLCLHNYTRGKMTDFGLDMTITRLSQVGALAASLYDQSMSAA